MQSSTKDAVADVQPKGTPSRKKRFMHKVRSGCLSCRQRKIKCDETRPQCKKCIIHGVGCKYPLDSAVALLPKMQRPNSTGFPSTQPASPQQSNPILTQISSFVTRDISDLIHLIPQLPVKLSSAVNFLQVARRTTEKHLAYIPSLSRNSVALEAAMRCLAESVRWYYLSKSQPPSVESSQDFVSAMRYRMLSLNTQALAHLQSTLNNKKIALSAETILTVQLHCCFEAFRSEGDYSLKHHIRGMEHLIDTRGPAGIQTEFDAHLLTSLLVLMVSDSFFRHKSCFVYHDRWRPVMYKILRTTPYPESTLVDYAIYAGPIHETFVNYTNLILQSKYQNLDRKITRLMIKKQASLFQYLRNRGTPLLTLYQSYEAAAGYLLYEDNVDRTKPGYDIRSITERSVGSWLAIVILYYRLMATMSAGAGNQDGIEFESHCQRLAQRRVAIIRSDPKLQSSRATMVEMATLDGIVATEGEWYDFTRVGKPLAAPKLVSVDIYIRWLALMGIQTV